MREAIDDRNFVQEKKTYKLAESQTLETNGYRYVPRSAENVQGDKRRTQDEREHMHDEICFGAATCQGSGFAGASDLAATLAALDTQPHLFRDRL